MKRNFPACTGENPPESLKTLEQRRGLAFTLPGAGDCVGTSSQEEGLQ